MKNIVFTYITPFPSGKGRIGRVTDTLTREFLKRGFTIRLSSAVTVRHEYDYPALLTYLPSQKLMAPENLLFYNGFLRRHFIDYVINQSGNFADSQLWTNTGETPAKVISVLHSEPLAAYRHLWREIIPLRDCSFIQKLKKLARMALYSKR